MSISWFNKNDLKLVTTVNPNHLTLNAPCKPLFEKTDRVRLGYDHKKQIAIIDLLDRDDVQSYKYQEDELFGISMQMSYVRINCTAFIDLLQEHITSLEDGDLPKKFVTKYDEVKQQIIIELGREGIIE